MILVGFSSVVEETLPQMENVPFQSNDCKILIVFIYNKNEILKKVFVRTFANVDLNCEN